MLEDDSSLRLTLIELDVPGYIHEDASEREAVVDLSCLGGSGFHTNGLSHGLHSYWCSGQCAR